MRAWSNSLSIRTILGIWAVSVLSSLLAAVVAGLILINDTKVRALENLDDITEKLVDVMFIDLTADRELARLPVEVPHVLGLSKFDVIVRVFDDSFQSLYVSRPTLDLSFLDPTLHSKNPSQLSIVDGIGKKFYVISKSYKLLSGEKRIAQFAMPIPKISEALRNSWRHFLIEMAIMLVLSLFVAHFLTTRILRPIKTVSKYLGQLKNVPLRQWMPIPSSTSSDFLEAITTATNNLIGLVQQSYLSNQYLARYVAHEIRTPLTMMLGELETNRDSQMSPQSRAMLERFSKDIIQIEIILQTILELAKKGKPELAYHPKNLDIITEISTLIEELTRLQMTHVEIELLTHRPTFASVDRDLFRLLMSNLIRNSICHGSTKPNIRISVSQISADKIMISIQDDGPGMPRHLLDLVNNRTISHENVGIGLSLCWEICNLGGWYMTFENTSPKGLNVGIVISAAPNQRLIPLGFRTQRFSDARPS